jgi:hypothetical protein
MCLRCAGWTGDEIARHHARLVDAHHLLPDLEVTFGHVHHRNLAGEWFTQWPSVARACGEGTTSLRALQVRVDQLDDCDVCFHRQRALERPCSVSALVAVCHPEPSA